MRCAIYTRKSDEEGLGQPFNSLDAQRESAEAYILSQQHAGWILLAGRYDDGGFTGAHLERPGLQRLLSDLGAGRIDCVVVYKVDRLSRSLLDFARLMGIFEKHGVNLVSVTQPFNTTTSLGRLTLNILLSFAQFEREIIAERTRDKMSAARRRGQWVGGIPVLGYDVTPGGGKLVINEREAHQVREIFGLCLEHGALSGVLQEMQKRQWMTKRWTTKGGKLHPGRLFEEHDLVRLFSNVIYIGKVCYQGQIYAGEHDAIVEEEVWEKVQVLIQKRGRSVPKKLRTRLAPPAVNGTRTGRPQGNLESEMEPLTVRAESSPNGVPRITRLLALAVKFEGLLQQGVAQNYADLARLGRVSRARITQIMNLLSLAPDIQQQILSWSGETGGQSVRETWVRSLSAEVIWSRQRDQWNRCLAQPYPSAKRTTG
jgi:DNA invertase Pin-like site-specific DNA recombinase